MGLGQAFVYLLLSEVEVTSGLENVFDRGIVFDYFLRVLVIVLLCEHFLLVS